MAQVFFLKLNKKDPEMRIRLIPLGCDFIRVEFKIGGTVYNFAASGVMGDRFSSFLTSLYCLYEEDDLEHLHFWHRRLDVKEEFPEKQGDGKHSRVASVFFDGERYGYTTVTLARISRSLLPKKEGEPDPISISFECRGIKQSYTVDGRELCYAVARACTETLKKYGFKGYFKSSSGYYLGDVLDIEQLLFIKAYALGAMRVRATDVAWQSPRGWEETEASSFEDETELLLFDM